MEKQPLLSSAHQEERKYAQNVPKGHGNDISTDDEDEEDSWNVKKSTLYSNKRYYLDRDEPERDKQNICWWHNDGKCKFKECCHYANHLYQDHKTEPPFVEEAQQAWTYRNIIQLKPEIKSYAEYSQNKLMKSGDIEEEPGPKTSEKERRINLRQVDKRRRSKMMHNQDEDISKIEKDDKLQNDGEIEQARLNRATMETETDIYNPIAESKVYLSQDASNTSPKKIQCLNIVVTLLATLVLLLITGISIYNIKATETSPVLKIHLLTSAPQIKKNLISISNLLTLINKKKKKYIKIRTRAAYLVILLILAGDIHQNPGPRQTNEGNCLVCKEPESNKSSLTCDTCSGWTHLSCRDESKNYSNLLNKSYEWHCPNPHCLPNFHQSKDITLNHTQNRYIFNKIPRKRKNGYAKSSSKTTKLTEFEMETKVLFKQLTKISSKIYIGFDRCRICQKNVGENHRAVSCDVCEHWLHIGCTDMESNTYKKFRASTKFSWTCHKCRKLEIPSTSKANLTLLKSHDYPKLMEDLNTNAEEHLILHFNCQSIMNKTEELIDICNIVKPTLVCLTETWMDSSVPQNFIVPEGYSIIRKDRSENFKQHYGKANGGGIAVLHKSSVKVKLKQIADQDEETLWLEVLLKKKILIGVVYRGSYTDLLHETEETDKLSKMLETAHLSTDNVVVLGDFNCDTSSDPPDYDTCRLIEACTAYGMDQLINKPTRITEDKTSTIDHIWVDRKKELIKECGTCMGIGQSDHLGIYAKINLRPSKLPPPETKLRRDWRNYNEDDLKYTIQTLIEESNIHSLIAQEDVNKSLLTLTEILQQATDEHAPMKSMKERPKTATTIPWYDKEIQELKKEKNQYLQLFYLLRNQRDKERAKILNNKLTHLKGKKKKFYYTNKLSECEGDSKKEWNILRELTNGYTEKQDIEPDNMNQSEANRYNDFFATVGSEIQKKLNVTDIEVVAERKGFNFIPESEENTIKLIERIRTNVAVGADGINAKVLKDAKFIIAPVLTKIINLGYKKNIFPDELKIAVVKAIHKKECHNNPANYRPISILSVISKVFERSAVDQLVKHFETHNLLSGCQHAYRKRHSTVTCLAEITNNIYESLDKGQIVGLASTDLSKAFDAICHSHLLQKLCNMGLHKNTIYWIKSYLTSRKQRTSFKKVTSLETTVTSGVPQGSILGPILFLCYTNDLTSSFPEAKVTSYADDTQFIVTGTSMEIVKQKLEQIIQKAEVWYRHNSLMSNPSKTEVMIFTPTRNQTLPTIDCFESGKKVELKVSKHIKILGVHIDCNMKWDYHVTQLRKKTIGIVRHLHRTNKILPTKTKLKLYDSLVASHFNYADVIWSGCNQSNKQKLQSVQNFALKSVLQMKKFESATQALQTLHYLNLEEKRNIHEAVFTHKAVTGKMPTNITEEYTKLKPRLNNRSAENGTLNIPKHKTTRFQSSILYRSVKAWNNTDTSLRQEETHLFKRHLQSTTTKLKYQTSSAKT